MNPRSARRAERASLALAAGAFITAFGIATATAHAATFTSAGIAVEPRGEEAGGLTCKWRETGLGPSQVVYYSCGAASVSALKACVYKNRVIFGSPTRLDTFTNVFGGEHGAAEPFLSQKNGQISASTTTPIPHVETQTELCTAPSEEAVVAVRWCSASLTDVTNGLVGTTLNELYMEFFSGVGTVPPCAP